MESSLSVRNLSCRRIQSRNEGQCSRLIAAALQQGQWLPDSPSFRHNLVGGMRVYFFISGNFAGILRGTFLRRRGPVCRVHLELVAPHGCQVAVAAVLLVALERNLLRALQLARQPIPPLPVVPIEIETFGILVGDRDMLVDGLGLNVILRMSQIVWTDKGIGAFIRLEAHVE